MIDIVKLGSSRWQPSPTTHEAEADIIDIKKRMLEGKAKLFDFAKSCRRWKKAGTESKSEGNKIVFELTESKAFIRWPCNVCGGSTEKVGVLCEVKEGEWKGWRICETCLEKGDADASLTLHIKRLEDYTANLRLLLGRIEAPTYEDWLKAEEIMNER